MLSSTESRNGFPVIFPQSAPNFYIVERNKCGAPLIIAPQVSEFGGLLRPTPRDSDGYHYDFRFQASPIGRPTEGGMTNVRTTPNSRCCNAYHTDTYNTNEPHRQRDFARIFRQTHAYAIE